MAIGLLCCKCWKSTSNLNSKRCECGYAYRRRKYKVRVKTSTGWRTRTVASLSEAQLIETGFKRTSSEVWETSQEDTTPDPMNIITTPSLSDIWPLYLEWAKVSKKSWDMDFSRYKNHLKMPLSHYPMDSIKPFHIQKILNKMHTTYKPATVKQVLMLIKRIYSWSLEQDLYEGPNPCDRIKPPKFDNRVTVALTKEELQSLFKVLDGWPNERVVLPIKFALYSGKRKTEILNLKWSDIDLQNKFMTLRETKNGSRQYLPLNSSCIELLKRAAAIQTCEYVFPSRNKARYLGGGFDKTWRKIRKKAGITIRFHDLRHTYASYLASSGKVDIYTLKELLGHSTIEMTQRYAHLVNGALRKAVNVADEVF